jgi:glycerol-3-phosphate dehydrogenase
MHQRHTVSRPVSRPISNEALPTAFDVAVVGGGVVGCAVLRELSRYGLKLLLLEKEPDLAEGISKGNSGVIHAGFNVPSGTLKAKTNVDGLSRVYKLARELGVPHRKTGKLVVAVEASDRPRLEELKAQGDRNGTPGLEIVDESAIRALAPNVRGRWALSSPHTGIISPYEFTLALADCALANGARILCGTPLTGVEVRPDGYLLGTPRGSFATRWVVNCAGLDADEVAALAGIADYKIYAYRGEYLIADREAGEVLGIPVYPVPPRDDSFLGVHLTPTLHGNVLLGPSSAYVEDKRDAATTRAMTDRLKAEAFELVPALRRFPFIHAYAGLRPKLTDPQGKIKLADFIVEESRLRPRWVNLVGIESPGLTAAPSLAAMVADIIGAREDIALRPDFVAERPAVPKFADGDDAGRAARVEADADWGEMVCRCEHVTRAEVLAAVRNPFGAVSLDAVKRRTRCGMGRCQGGFCGPRVAEILQAEGVPPERISKRGPGSELFFGRNKP